MQINEVHDREKLQSIVVNLLKEYGVKHNKDRKIRPDQKKHGKVLFGVQLQQLDLADVILAHGNVVQIPRFVADACQRILENVQIEGIFRKAGSSTRQKEIRVTLESGVALGRSHHVIDVANVLKYFIRELPEPLISATLQQTLLRSYLLDENRINAILLTCLLLPTLEANVLAFFMQFLLTVSLSEKWNKMSTENLAIIFTPSIMPCLNVNSARFNQHVKTVQLLIEQANSIGNVPEVVKSKLLNASNKKNGGRKSLELLDNVVKHHKPKRRSEIFTGLKKMVGSSRNNLVDLEETPVVEKKPADDKVGRLNLNEHPSASQPRSAKKKRKFADPIYTFSAKKKKDAQNTPKNHNNNNNTPLSRKTTKMPRRSLGGSRFMKSISHSINPVSVGVERRWSLVGPSWSKQQNTTTTKQLLDTETHRLPAIEDVAQDNHKTVEKVESLAANVIYSNSIKINFTSENIPVVDNVATIQIEKPLDDTDDTQLALGVRNKLRIRCLEEEAKLKHTRSPRVRKIGAPRNHDKRLTRTATWHISSTKSTELQAHRNETVPVYKAKKVMVKSPDIQLLTPIAEKQAKIASNLTGENWTPADSFFTPAKPIVNELHIDTDNIKNLRFMQETTFQTPKTPKRHNKTNNSHTKTNNKDIMLPPNRLPMQKLRTPRATTTPGAGMKHLAENSQTPQTPSVDENGRASIARLRTQNAGQVMAKAKLFDGLVDGVTRNNEITYRKTSRDFAHIRK